MNEHFACWSETTISNGKILCAWGRNSINIFIFMLMLARITKSISIFHRYLYSHLMHSQKLFWRLWRCILLTRSHSFFPILFESLSVAIFFLLFFSMRLQSLRLRDTKLKLRINLPEIVIRFHCEVKSSKKKIFEIIYDTVSLCYCWIMKKTVLNMYGKAYEYKYVQRNRKHFVWLVFQ